MIMQKEQSLNQTLQQYKVIRELQEKIGNFRGETIYDLFRRYQKIKMPDIPEDILAIQEYKPEWKKIFLEERYSIKFNGILHIEHIGSTSINNQSSNNIIDIALIVERNSLKKVSNHLNLLGYSDFGNSPLGIKANWLWKIDIHRSIAFVVHLDCNDNLWFQDTIDFKNFLTLNPYYLKKHNDLKKGIFELKQNNPLLYSIKKIELTNQIIQKSKKQKKTL